MGGKMKSCWGLRIRTFYRLLFLWVLPPISYLTLLDSLPTPKSSFLASDKRITLERKCGWDRDVSTTCFSQYPACYLPLEVETWYIRTTHFTPRSSPSRSSRLFSDMANYFPRRRMNRKDKRARLTNNNTAAAKQVLLFHRWNFTVVMEQFVTKLKNGGLCTNWRANPFGKKRLV